jgi:dTMP kinase
LDLDIIQNVINQIVENDLTNDYSHDIPIFSFEGLPGAGKTTQIKKASKDLRENFGNSYYIDLPTESSAGLLLRALYSNKVIWERIRLEHPWINPVLLSADLRLAVQKAKNDEARFIFMSRGILSTYYYNFSAYLETYKDFELAWKELTKSLNGFILPDVIVFFEIDPEEAHKRVVKRAREPLREMDLIHNMENDLILFKRFIKRIEKIVPIHYIDGSLTENQVTSEIEKILLRHLEVDNVEYQSR